MSKEQLQETVFNTFPRRIQRSFRNEYELENVYVECILCKKRIRKSESEHKCDCRKVDIIIKTYN